MRRTAAAGLVVTLVTFTTLGGSMSCSGDAPPLPTAATQPAATIIHRGRLAARGAKVFSSCDQESYLLIVSNLDAARFISPLGRPDGRAVPPALTNS